MTKTFSIYDVPDEHVFRTEDNRWFKVIWHGEFNYRIFNDIGIIDNYWDDCEHGKIIQIEKDFLGIRENEFFELKMPKTVTFRNINANSNLFFVSSIGSRVRCQMKDYKFEIPFWFKTIDPRVEKAEGFWKISNGRVFQHLFDNQLSIYWENNKVILNAGLITIPSE